MPRLRHHRGQLMSVVSGLTGGQPLPLAHSAGPQSCHLGLVVELGGRFVVSLNCLNARPV